MNWKRRIRTLFYRSEGFRGLVGIASNASGRTRRLRLLHLLSYDDEGAIGPLQQDEAVALFGIVRALRPATVVEFGFFHGHSAFNFLMALEDDAMLASYDIGGESRERAEHEFPRSPSFRFFPKSQTEFDPADVDHRPLDLVFFDAAHELELNQRTFAAIRPHLAPGALVAVHDTGVWSPEFLSEPHREFMRTMPVELTASGAVIHQPGERDFVRWVLETHPGFQALHLHSRRTLRHGLTLLQAGPGFPDETA